jgi:capsular exopolysaccharide synthesis family protein
VARLWRRLSGRNGGGGAPLPTDSRGLLITPDGDGLVAEPFRMLRSSVLQMGESMIMVTSPLDKEGKTLCAANLAISLSLTRDREVVLVDLDLRRPGLSTRLGLERGPGVVNCLLGEARWEDCLRPTSYTNLRLLSAGTQSHAAPELLASASLRQMLAEIRGFAESHYVIVDTPPLLLTADPLTIAGQMSAAILVVRAGGTPKAALEKAVELLGPEKLLGVVFNQATAQASDFYRYGAYGSYGVKYGYLPVGGNK